MEHLRAGERLSPASGSPATWLCRRVTSAPRPFNDDHQRTVGHVPVGQSFPITGLINHNRRARQGVVLTVKRLFSPEKASERPTDRGRLGWGVTHWPDLEAARQGRPDVALGGIQLSAR